MIFRVIHKTNYIYSGAVFLEPHIVRLCPRNETNQKISNFSLTVEPQPLGIHHFLDAEGNCATCIWFEAETATLSITTSFEAQTFCKNPFSYLVTDNSFLQLPVLYENFDAIALEPFRSAIEIDDAVTTFGKSVFEDSNGDTLNFLSRLCLAIYNNFKVKIREHGPPFPPSITFQNKRGACRDLVLL